MKQIKIICVTALLLSMLSGCMYTSPKDEEFQEDWNESMEELRRDRQEDEDASWSGWVKSWQDWGEHAEELFSDEKAHSWRILDGDGAELSTVTDAKAVEALDDLLSDDDTWEHLEREEPGDPACSYIYSQEKTLLAGQDPEEEREYEDLMRFTVSASEDIVTMQVLGGLEELSLLPGISMEDVLTFSASVPAETADALRNPSEFTQ